MSHTAFSRALRLANILIAMVAAAVLAALYWYVWRPLPQRSGRIDAPVGAAVNVVFDRLGEPHIRAGSFDDALFAQGYIAAQDRLWQMDALRRYAAGDLAEVLGPALLETDRESRGLRMRRTAEEAYVTMPASDRAAFAAYTRGVNYFISSHLTNLPVEFTLLQYQPRPWSVVDCLLICLHMFRDLTTSWKDELIKRSLLAGGDPKKVDFCIPSGWATSPFRGRTPGRLRGAARHPESHCFRTTRISAFPFRESG